MTLYCKDGDSFNYSFKMGKCWGAGEVTTNLREVKHVHKRIYGDLRSGTRKTPE